MGGSGAEVGADDGDLPYAVRQAAPGQGGERLRPSGVYSRGIINPPVMTGLSTTIGCGVTCPVAGLATIKRVAASNDI
jgi:hypothetical protein